MASMGDGMVSRQTGHSKQTLDCYCRLTLTSGFLFYGYGFELSVSAEAYDTIMERGSHECK